jgi:hypothetical protein
VSERVTCRCFLPTQPPPEGIEWWRPDLDPDPGLSVHAVVRWGDQPELRRAVRLANGTGWEELGALVNFYRDRTPPMPWSRVGRCWDDTPHPVVAVRAQPDGTWEYC